MFIFITGSEYNVSGPVIIIGFVTGSMLSLWDSCVDMLLTEIWIHARAVTVTEEYWYHLRP